MAEIDTVCYKEFTILDKRMILSILLNQTDQTVITKILRTGSYRSTDEPGSQDKQPKHTIILDWYGNINHNGDNMHTKTIKAEFVCNIEKTIKKLSDIKNSTDKKNKKNMNSLHFCVLMRTVGTKLQKILALLDLNEIDYNFDRFNYKVYQNAEYPELYIIEKSFKLFNCNLIIPECIIIFDNYVCVDRRKKPYYF